MRLLALLIQRLLKPQDQSLLGLDAGPLPGQVVDGLATLSACLCARPSGVASTTSRLRPSRVLIRRDRGVEI